MKGIRFAGGLVLRPVRWYARQLRRGFLNVYFGRPKPRLIHSEKQNSNTKPMNWFKDATILVGFVTCSMAFIMMF